MKQKQAIPNGTLTLENSREILMQYEKSENEDERLLQIFEILLNEGGQ